MRRTLALLAAMVVSLGLWSTPAAAVTDGVPDTGNDYPFVGLMVAQDDEGNPLWRCSGTLISPTLFLTAGHCTYGADHVEIWFDADVESGIPENGYPFQGDVGGTPYTHPEYDETAFYLHDLGIVVLDEPIYKEEYGQLPELNELDALSPGAGTVFTAVGYGLQKSFPDAASWKEQAERVRLISHPHLLQINSGIVGDFSLLLSNNAHTGGTCFGDSGGPNFIGDTNVIAGVTSFGLNSTCAGTGGVYRIDRADDLEWLATFFTTSSAKKKTRA
jgi:V8-like Glu-specific endopeptidase